MSTFNFTPVDRGTMGFHLSIPEDTVRISSKRISFGESVSKNFGSVSYEDKAGNRRIRIAIATDQYNQALEIKPSAEGFSVAVSEVGSGNGSLPSNFRKAGMPTGDYKLVPGERYIYQLAR